jgi:RNA polymerase sigma factor (sigma-70 family)
VDSPQSNPVTAAASETARWFAEEIAPHEGALRAYLSSWLNPVEIDDIVQETFARVLRAHERAAIASPRGLLFAIARNTARTLHRDRNVVEFLPITETVASRVLDEAPGVVETVCRQQDADRLRAAIADLPPRCREILVLRKFENLSHREIAQKLGIAEHTVEAQLTKALQRCGKFLKRMKQ